MCFSLTGIKMCAKMDTILFSLTILLFMPDDISSSSVKCNPILENGEINTSKSTASCFSGYSLIPSDTTLYCPPPNEHNTVWTPSPSCSKIETSIFSSSQTTGMNTIKATTISLETKTWTLTITAISDIATSVSPSFESHLTTTVNEPSLILTSSSSHIIASSTKLTLSPTADQSVLDMTSTNEIVPTATQSSTSVSATTTPVMTNQKDEKTSDTRAVYIAVPVVACAIAVIVVIVVLIWRRKKNRPHALKREKTPASPLTNKSYAVHAINRQCSLINVRLSGDSGYAEITSDPAHLEKESDNVYNTIENLPEDKSGSNNTYGHLKQHEKGFTGLNYSHIKPNSMAEKARTDNTYAHTTLSGLLKEAQKSSDDVDDTYNLLNTATNERKTTEEEKETDGEYSHAKSGCQESEHGDTYSHLNSALPTAPKHLQTGQIQLKEKKMSNHNPNIQPYDLAKEPKPRQYNYAVVSPKSKNAAYDFAEELDTTPYEFARGFNKLSNDGMVKPDPVQIEMQTSEIKMKTYADENGYEKAAGTPHNYFILEPEERTSDKETSFRVVDEELSKARHTDDNEEPENHQYFTLERVDT